MKMKKTLLVVGMLLLVGCAHQGLRPVDLIRPPDGWTEDLAVNAIGHQLMPGIEKVGRSFHNDKGAQMVLIAVELSRLRWLSDKMATWQYGDNRKKRLNEMVVAGKRSGWTGIKRWSWSVDLADGSGAWKSWRYAGGYEYGGQPYHMQIAAWVNKAEGKFFERWAVLAYPERDYGKPNYDAEAIAADLFGP